MEIRKLPPPVRETKRPGAGWRRKWPIVTMVSAIGIISLVGAIVWSYTAQLRKFPPDVADPTALALALPELPSVVVLPVASVTLTDRDTLLAGRFGDDLIRVLARVPGLFVISPETSGRFGGGQFRIKSTAEALGVEFLISGTLTRLNKKYRVFLRVTNAFNGDVEWIDDFDVDPNDLYKLPGIALAKILDSMDVDIAEDEVARLADRGPTSAKAWIAHAEAMAYRVDNDRQSMSNSLARLLEAHAADPRWADVTAEIAWTYLNAARRGWAVPGASSVPEVARKGIEFAEKVMREDPSNSLGPAHKAALLALAGGDSESLVALWRDAGRLGSNTFAIQWELAQILIRAGRHKEALPVMVHALRIHPRHPVALTQALAELQFAAGEPEAAFASLDAVIEKRPAAEDPRLMRVYVLGALGRKPDAAAEAGAFLKLYPDFSFSRWSARQKRRGRPTRSDWRDVLREAGISD
jgi:adenylate cyclase